MPYATGRTFYDADSHIMELPDFLTRFADPAVRDELPQLAFEGGRNPLGRFSRRSSGHQPRSLLLGELQSRLLGVASP